MTTFNPDVLVNDEFIIMRSASIDNVHKALKSGLWTSTSRSNEKLNGIYN